MLFKCGTQYASKFGKLSSGHRTEKVFIPVPKKDNAKECSNCCRTALISHVSNVMLKSFKLGFNTTWIENFQMYLLDLEKVEETDQITNICWIIQKAREFQKNVFFCSIDDAKAFDCVDHNKLWKILKEMGIPDHLTCLLRNLSGSNS